MKLQRNPFTHALAALDKQVGLWVSMASPSSAAIISPAGYDWVVIDMEHTHAELGAVLGQLKAFEASETSAIVRVPWNDAVMVKRVLDIGAMGLMFPMIQNVEEARAAVAATRYPPHGVRGYAGSTHATKFGRVADYVERIDEELTVILQLETAEAIAQADKIAAVEGVSGVFFGPADIAADIGHTGQPMHPNVWDLVKPAAKKLRANGVACGTLVLDAEFAAGLLNEDFTFVACGTDTAVLARGADALLADVKGRVG
jgi:4-hydroxy-2-oxoheptanedioate aldolase